MTPFLRALCYERATPFAPCISHTQLSDRKIGLVCFQRHMERASELVEESLGASGGGSGGGALGALARTLKQHLRGFSEKVDDARQKFEDAHRCFYLVQKVRTQI